MVRARVVPLLVEDAEAGRPPLWLSDARTGQAARFELRGWIDADQFFLHVGASLHRTTRFGPVPVGAEELEIVLSPSGTIRGRILADEGVEVRESVTVDAEDPSGTATAGRVLLDGRFEVSKLPPGVVQVRLLRAGTEEPLALVEGVRVEAHEETADPRLVLDLRGRL